MPALENSMDAVPSKVDVAFPLTGNTLPLDHGYALFGSICRVLGDLHGASWLSVHPVSGEVLGSDVLRLFSGRRGLRSWLRLRVEPGHIPAILALAGAQLELDGHCVRVGTPNVYPLTPSPALTARMVVIKGFVEEKAFEEAVQRQLSAYNVQAALLLGRRRVIHIRDASVVGFGVQLMGLSDEHSLLLQERGLGGRQHFGCGVLVPYSEKAR